MKTAEKEINETWHVVFRRGKPVAAFLFRGLAEQFVGEATYRLRDTIVRRRMQFKGVFGYDQKKK